jgi:integrase
VNGSLYIKDTKNHRVRVVPLPEVLLSELQTHIDSGYAGAEVDCLVHVNGDAVTASAAAFLFSSVNGGLLRHSNTYVRFFKPALIEAGLDPALRFHDLRHSAASVAGSRHYGDQSAKVVQALLGHSSQQVTTEIYTHIFPEEFETLKDKLNVIYGDVFEGDEGQTQDSPDRVVELDMRRARRA